MMIPSSLRVTSSIRQRHTPGPPAKEVEGAWEGIGKGGMEVEREKVGAGRVK